MRLPSETLIRESTSHMTHASIIEFHLITLHNGTTPWRAVFKTSCTALLTLTIQFGFEVIDRPYRNHEYDKNRSYLILNKLIDFLYFDDA